MKSWCVCVCVCVCAVSEWQDTPNAFWYDNVLLRVSVNPLHEREIGVETLHSEQSVHKGVEQPLVKIIVDPSSINALGEKGSQGTPGNLVGREVGPSLGDAVQPRVERVAAHSQVRLVELVFLGPAERSVSKPFLDDGMEPRQQEIEPGPLVRLLTRKTQNIKN